MPCSYCNEFGHNIRTCEFKINKKRYGHINLNIQDHLKMKKKIENLEEINAKLYHNNEVIKSKFDAEKRKREQDMGTIIVNRCKFRSAMLILKDRNINKTTAAEPQNIPFDCPVCFEKKYTGIECDNGHKLCSNCSYENLWFSNQTCPCCRIPYQNQPILDVCNKSGIEIGINDKGERTVKMSNLINLVTRDMQEGSSFDVQLR